MSRAIITESKLTAIADAIRAKTGGTEELTVDEMASVIATIGGLPSAYQRVDYIQTADTAHTYLEIDYYIKATDNCYGTFYADSSKFAAWSILFGAVDSSQSFPSNCIKACRIAFVDTSSQLELVRGGNAGRGTAYTNKVFNVAIINGIYKAQIYTSTNIVSTVGENGQSNIQDCIEKCRVFTNSATGLRMYGLTITDSNNIPQVILVPCYRKSDNEIGAYDLVTDTFYTNKGDGTFIKGADV